MMLITQQTTTPESCLYRLLEWAEARDFAGYDVYDGLTLTDSPAILRNRLANQVITQAFKKSPVNVRPLLGMPKTKMPKAVGLFTHAYATLAERAEAVGDHAAAGGLLARMNELADWLLEHTCPGYSGASWNFGFNYRLLFEMPTVVITAVVARGLFEAYRVTGREDLARALRTTCDFILQDLVVTEGDEGICFSYTPRENTTRPRTLDCCYNASLLGAEVLARVYSLTGESLLRDNARAAVDFVVAHQKPDGRWNYSIDPETGVEREQVDFHQGFILDSLHACMTYADLPDVRYHEALERGARFYRDHQFTSAGRALWRLPKRRPADIHCQAQGILTFSRLGHLDPSYPSFARTIIDWTMRHMLDESGFFHYRRGRVFTNRIPYMRWAQGWMALALADYLSKKVQTEREVVSA